ncbi:hypothetical protein HDV06_002324 [Boothiomyces sp. JEL0866]|nr:hypothetical protein HDV06_002324 [Boothiomyces sp. JEL0866]
MKKIQLDAMRPWIVENVNLILGFDDDICIEFIMSLLEEESDPKEIQLKITGFLEDSTFGFMKKLWTLLVSAQSNPMGIPQEFMDKQKEEIRKQRERDIAIFEEIKRVREEEDAKRDSKKSGKSDYPDKEARQDDRERRRERDERRDREYPRTDRREYSRDERREGDYGDRRDRDYSYDREYRREREYRSNRDRQDRPYRNDDEATSGKIHPSRQSYHEGYRYRSKSPRERKRHRDSTPEPVYEKKEKPRWERPARE